MHTCNLHIWKLSKRENGFEYFATSRQPVGTASSLSARQGEASKSLPDDQVAWKEKGILGIRLLAGIFVLLLTSWSWPALAQQTSPSVPAVPVEVPAVPLENVPDLNQTPPIALMSVIRLIRLGVYPLDEDLSADPNRPTIESDLAFMLINLFMPGIAGEWPIDQGTALTQLDVQSQGIVSESGDVIITGVIFLPLLYAVLDLTPGEEAALRAQLIEALPAWQLGNFDAPLTRAATAILLSATLDFLEERQAQG